MYAACTLTLRERQVLAALAEGLTRKEIAWQLGVTERTIRLHTRRACERLGALTPTQAVVIAVREHLIAA